ncbi:hypothetical protein [Neolewinella persica]|uniref:hypothetical protein n=1 Tax=Neolewinella persica TaxID=70998 RepID=UPI00038083E7|nr:hypothetical protein [Neolewinella persica]
MSEDLRIGFHLLDIKRLTFNLDAGVDIAESEYKLSVQLGFGAAPGLQRVKAVPRIIFEVEGEAFITLELALTFAIAPNAWERMINEDGDLILPVGFARHLGVIGVGTARGFLSAKLEGDPDYSQLVLPTVDLTQTVTEDIGIAFAEEE